jgi:hypothetical protein
VSTKDIRTSTAHATCDVCGRTLLRGERLAVYLDGSERKSVCELCGSRALHEGWVREGTVPAFDGGGAPERKPSLLRRLRGRRGAGRSSERPTLADDLDGRAWADASAQEERSVPREPRHVRAVPTSEEQRIASAIEAFNASEHRRTVAGVARSLGEPAVTVLPSEARASLVNVVVSWELCWYRYEVDLGDELPSVRVAAQGYELDELAPEERLPTATSDEYGSLSPIASNSISSQ